MEFLTKLGITLLLAILILPQHTFAQTKCIPEFPRDCAIVLTFDDGPRKEFLYARGVMDLLRREQIKATFFVQGWQATANAELVRELVRHGHIIANHTNGHATPKQWGERKHGKKPPAGKSEKEWGAFLFEVGKARYLTDVEKGAQAIYGTAGYYPLFFRPPLWEIDKELYCTISDTLLYFVQVTPQKAFEYDCPSFEVVKKAWEIMDRDTRIKRKSAKEYFDAEKKNSAARRDVNTADYDFHDWFVRISPSRSTKEKFLQWLKKHFQEVEAYATPSELFSFSERYEKDPQMVSAEALALAIERQVLQRLKKGIKIDILVLHEISVTAQALQIAIPRLRMMGYRFENLPFIYGISGCVGKNPDHSFRCN